MVDDVAVGKLHRVSSSQENGISHTEEMQAFCSGLLKVFERGLGAAFFKKFPQPLMIGNRLRRRGNLPQQRGQAHGGDESQGDGAEGICVGKSCRLRVGEFP